jgi:hypothetical protein
MGIPTGAYLNGAIPGTITIRNKRRQGGSTEVSYTGTPQQAASLYELYYLEGYEVTLTTGQDTGVWTMNAILNRDVINNPVVTPPPVERWTLGKTAVQQSLLECTDRPTIALLTTQGKEYIESQIKNPTNMATAKYQGTDKAAVIQVYNLMRLGTDSRQTSFPVLKRRVTVPYDYNLGWSTANDGKVLSTQTLLNLYGSAIPFAVQSVLPASNSPFTDINGVTTFGGWLQEIGIDVDEVGDNNKVEVTQQWQYGNRWAAIEYDQI